MLRAALQANGFFAWEVHDAHQAILFLGKHGGKVRAALVDLHVPGGGLAVVKSLRGLLPGLPCCLMTASVEGDGFTREQLAESNVAGVLFKPFRVGQLVETLQKLVDPSPEPGPGHG
jgi:CheY-like chemotaxis protein